MFVNYLTKIEFMRKKNEIEYNTNKTISIIQRK